ncbi:MAG: TPM domain-containing protein [Flavobacteriia bacterium]|nr:TPM domain-containing protein [Flavobacteriia bacterium]
MIRQFLITLFVLTVHLYGSSQRLGIPEKPNPPRLFNNLSKEFPDFVSSEQTQILESKLLNFEKETSNEITVVIVDDLKGYEPWDFATEIGHQWKVGKEKEDNGIVFLIKPTGDAGQRKVFIGVGRGLEGAIPDLTANRIVENEVIPNFKNGDFYQGIDQGITVLMQLAKGEINKKDYAKKGDDIGIFGVLFILFIIFIIVFSIIKGKGRGGGGGGLGRTLGSAAFFSSAFSGGSSSGGGGFGGFGGGSFGGGGSGGSW